MSCSYIAMGHTIHSFGVFDCILLLLCSVAVLLLLLLFLLLFWNWPVACVHSYMNLFSVEMGDDDDDAGHARGHRFLSLIH